MTYFYTGELPEGDSAEAEAQRRLILGRAVDLKRKLHQHFGVSKSEAKAPARESKEGAGPLPSSQLRAQPAAVEKVAAPLPESKSSLIEVLQNTVSLIERFKQAEGRIAVAMGLKQPIPLPAGKLDTRSEDLKAVGAKLKLLKSGQLDALNEKGAKEILDLIERVESEYDVSSSFVFSS